MKKIVVLTMLGVFVLFTGCKSDHNVGITYKDETPKQHVLRITTDDGETIDLALGNEVDPKTLIALQTALSNVLILKAELIQNEAEHVKRQDSLTALKMGLYTLCFLATLTACTVVVAIWIKRGGC